MAGELFVQIEYYENGDAMDNTTHSQSHNILVDNSSFMASAILMDVNGTIGNIHMLVAVILRYVNTGVLVTNHILGLTEAITATIEDKGEK